MNNLLWVFIGISVALFETILYFEYANTFFGRKSNTMLYSFIFVSIFVENAAVSTIVQDPVQLLINTLVLNMIISCLLFDGEFNLKLISSVMILVVTVISEIIAGLLIVFLGNTDITYLQNDSPYRLAGIIISKIILFIFVKVIGRYCKEQSGSISFRYWSMLMLIPVISILAINQIAASIDAKTGVILPLVSSIGVMFINVMVFILLGAILERSQLQIKYNFAEQQLNNQMKYFQSLEEGRKEINRIYHDMKNHMTCLYSIADEGNLPAVKDYLKGLNLMMQDAAKPAFTGNPIIDAVFYEKKMLANKDKIRMKIKGILPKVLDINPIDICIILGNALDNAIEACTKVEEGKREISFRVVLKENHLMITIINSSNGNYIMIHDRLQSTKAEASKHGLGLLNIESVVNKYQGNLSIKHDVASFTLSILMRNTAPQIKSRTA